MTRCNSGENVPSKRLEVHIALIPDIQSIDLIVGLRELGVPADNIRSHPDQLDLLAKIAMQRRLGALEDDVCRKIHSNTMIIRANLCVTFCFIVLSVKCIIFMFMTNLFIIVTKDSHT